MWMTDGPVPIPAPLAVTLQVIEQIRQRQLRPVATYRLQPHGGQHAKSMVVRRAGEWAELSLRALLRYRLAAGQAGAGRQAALADSWQAVWRGPGGAADRDRSGRRAVSRSILRQ